MLNNALGRIENAVPRTRCFSLCFPKRESGQMPERSRHCKEEQSCMDEYPVTGEQSLGRRSRARIPSQENCLFYAPRRSTRDGKGSRPWYRDDTAAFFVGKAFFIMKVQEVKPKGRRLIGELSLRAAHNVHELDVCACSLCSFWQCWRGVAGKRKGVRSSRRK